MPIAPPPPPPSHLNLFKEFFYIFSLLCFLIAIVAGMHYYSFYTTERKTLEASETLNVDLARRMIATDISTVVQDLRFLVEHIERQELIQLAASKRSRMIAQEFRVFAEKRGLYDQIRFLNESGMEVVRVNYDRGKTLVVPGEALQNKASRYYFRKALEQESGGIYISPLDLNVEGGEIQRPLKPMMRFGAPVFDHQGNKRGVVLLNYFGARLIQNFSRAAANIAAHIELVNSDGYWLSSPRKADEWGFMFNNGRTIGRDNHGEWKTILSAESGQFETESGLFTFNTIYPARVAFFTLDPWLMDEAQSGDIGPYWKIISRLSPEQLTAGLTFFIPRHWVLYLAMLLLATIGSFLLALTQARHRQAEAQGEYERRFRHTLENIELAAIALDQKGQVAFCNDYLLEITGWDRREMVGKNWAEYFVPEEQRAEMEKVLDCMKAPDTFPTRFESRVKTKGGGPRLMAWNNTLSYDTHGKAIGVTSIGEDITEQRRAEREILRLSSAVEQSPATVMITDRDGAIELGCRQLRNALETSHQHLSRNLHPENRPDLPRGLQKTLGYYNRRRRVAGRAPQPQEKWRTFLGVRIHFPHPG